MKLSASLGLLTDLWLAIKSAFIPTLSTLLGRPSLIFHSNALSRIFMAKVWSAYANGVDENGWVVKQSLIPPNARGIVLDIGAGHGHTAKYLDRARVTKYIALEPNGLMHDEIRKQASDAGFSEEGGTLLILACGAEDTKYILSKIGGANSVDTLISILVLCSVPSPERTLSALVREVLKPGGLLLYCEHVLSPRNDVAWWQRFWTPVWRRAFDGCRLDCPTHLWIERMDMWKDGKVWGKAGEAEENLFWHRVGRYVKR